MKFKTSQKAAFGFGAFGKDIVYMLISGYLLYYYNAVLGMDSAFIGLVLMVARVFDAINDPVMGIVVAKTKTKWGRFRPWILAGTILNAVTIYALFAAPDSLGMGGQKIWLIVFYFAWGITYTLMDIPFWSLIPAVTEPGKDREDLTSLARTCAGVGDAVPTVLTMVIVPLLSASSVIADYKIGFKWWAIIIAVVFVISEIVCVVSFKENSQNVQEDSKNIGEMFKALFANDQAVTVVASILLVYAAINVTANLILYFFQFDVGNEGAYATFAAISFAAQVVIMMVVPALRSKFSKNQLFIFGFGIQIVGYLVILLMSFTGMYTPATWYVFCIPGVMVYIGYGMLNVIMTVFLSDTVDYGELKNGSREESVIFSMQTFTVKLASGFAVMLSGQIINWVHLDVAADVQSAATLNGLRLWMTLPSIALLIVGVIVYKAKYKLDDAKMKEVMSELGR